MSIVMKTPEFAARSFLEQRRSRRRIQKFPKWTSHKNSNNTSDPRQEKSDHQTKQKFQNVDQRDLNNIIYYYYYTIIIYTIKSFNMVFDWTWNFCNIKYSKYMTQSTFIPVLKNNAEPTFFFLPSFSFFFRLLLIVLLKCTFSSKSRQHQQCNDTIFSHFFLFLAFLTAPWLSVRFNKDKWKSLCNFFSDWQNRRENSGAPI